MKKIYQKFKITEAETIRIIKNYFAVQSISHNKIQFMGNGKYREIHIDNRYALPGIYFTRNGVVVDTNMPNLSDFNIKLKANLTNLFRNYESINKNHKTKTIKISFLEKFLLKLSNKLKIIISDYRF